MRLLRVVSKYYCGIDLHKERMYICVIDQMGNILLHRNMRTDFQTFLRFVQPFLPNMIVGVESLFCYYWLFHGGKTKNDKIDSKAIADLLRSSHFPLAYPYPKEMRGARDLLRRRRRLVAQRAECYRHIQNVFTQQGRPILYNN